MIFSTI